MIQEKSFYHIVQIDAILITGILLLISLDKSDFFTGLTVPLLMFAIVGLVVSAFVGISWIGPKPNETEYDNILHVKSSASIWGLKVGFLFIGISAIVVTRVYA